MIIEALGLLELAILGLASYQDVKSREIDVWVVALLYVPALAAAYFSWREPIYLLSPVLGALLALVMRLTGSGYADSLAILALSLFPPLLPFLPTPAVVVIGTSASVAGTALWLLLTNRGRPCKMSALQKLTHICVSREEVLKAPHRYIIGDVKDLEKYRPPKDVKDDYVVAKYGVPYIVHLTLGFAIYLALYFIIS
ncbi:MAG: prepilin peptidase [Thermoproteus sp.]